MKKLILLFMFCPLLMWGQKLVQAEYFFDEDPGYGKAIKINFASEETIILNANLSIELISPGFHTLFYRFKDDANGWGHTYKSNIFIGSKIASLQETEYFFDSDPGYGKGITLTFEKTEPIVLNSNLNIENLEPGLHTFYYRVKSTSGWGSTFSHKVYKPSVSKICKLIYWFDDQSEKTQIELNPALHILNRDETIDITSLNDGEHQLHFYLVNTNGDKSEVWSSTFNSNDHSALGKTELQESFIYPNPASDRIYFKSNQPAKHISIVSMSGKVAKRADSAQSITINDLSEGIYLISYQIRNQLKVSTLIIQH